MMSLVMKIGDCIKKSRNVREEIMKKNILTMVLIAVVLLAAACTESVGFIPFGEDVDNPTSERQTGVLSLNLKLLIPDTTTNSKQIDLSGESLSRSVNVSNLKEEVNFFQVFIYNQNLIYTNSVNTSVSTMLNTEVYVGEYKVVLLAGHQLNIDEPKIAYLASGVTTAIIGGGTGTTTVPLTLKPIQMELTMPDSSKTTGDIFTLQFEFNTRNQEIVGPNKVDYSSHKSLAFDLWGNHVVLPQFPETGELNLPTATLPCSNNTYTKQLTVKFLTNNELFKLIGENSIALKTDVDQFLLDGNYKTKIFGITDEQHINTWLVPTSENLDPDKFEDVLKNATYTLGIGSINLLPEWE